MGVGTSVDPALIVAIVGGLGLVAAIITIGSQLVNSSDVTKKHLANATALMPAAAPTAHDAVQPESALKGGGFDFVAPEERFLRGSTRTISVPPSAGSDDASHRTFNLLNDYYLANISQGNTIFWASLLSMSLGFAIVFVGVVLAGVHSATAIVAAIAGVLSQFIGATFLVVLRSTQAQATGYAQSLVDLRLHDMRAASDAQSVELGLALLGQIADDGATALANQTRASIAMGLIVKSGATLAPSPAAPPPAADPQPGPTSAPGPRPRAETITFDETGSIHEQRVPDPGKP